MSHDGVNNSAMGTNNNSSLLQKFLNGDVDLRTIEQRDLRVRVLFSHKDFKLNLIFFLF